MKVPPFTLVHKRMSLRNPHEKADRASLRIRLLSDTEPRLADSLFSLKPRFRYTLVNSAFAFAPSEEESQSLQFVVPTLERIMDDLNRQSRVTKVGIWDLGVHAGFLPKLIERLNVEQPVFTFFKIQAAIPAGLISQPVRVAAWLRHNLGRSLKKSERDEIENNVIAEDFFKRAEEVRSDLGVDHLVGATPSMVALAEDNMIYWNHFAASFGRTGLVSGYELHDFASKANRPLEVAVAYLAIGELLVSLNRRLDYHDDTGCLFDYNESRISIVKSLKNPRIEDDCLYRMLPSYRAASVQLMNTLQTYSREDEHPARRGSGTPQAGRTSIEANLPALQET